MSVGKGFVYWRKSSRNYSGFDVLGLPSTLLAFYFVEEAGIGALYSGAI